MTRHKGEGKYQFYDTMYKGTGKQPFCVTEGGGHQRVIWGQISMTSFMNGPLVRNLIVPILTL